MHLIAQEAERLEISIGETAPDDRYPAITFAKAPSGKDMIAAYADVMTRPCDKCGMLLGKRPQLTTLRKKVRRGNLRKSEDRGAKSESVWAAYHVGCR